MAIEISNRYLSMAVALTIGAAGGAVAAVMDLPLAWMIGALVATTVASAAGLGISVSLRLRAVMVAVLGVMLGSSFRPEILGQLASWAVTLTALIGFIGISGGLGVIYFRRFGGYDPITAFFAAMPGGLSEMVLIGSAMGGDARIISLTHAARILLVVLTLPFAFQFFAGYEPALRPSSGPPILSLAAFDVLILGACGVVGFLAANWLKIPAAPVVGPMLLSAAVHLVGVTDSGPPLELVAVAQVIVGASLGCRFSGVALALIGRTLVLAVGATLLLLTITIGFAVLLNALTGQPVSALILAFAPGGLAEMSLIALALAMDAAFVATHHIVRIFLIVVIAPTAFRWMRRSDAGG